MFNYSYYHTVIYWYSPERGKFYLKFDDGHIKGFDPTYNRQDLVRKIQDYFLYYSTYDFYFSRIERYVGKIYAKYNLGCR